MEEWPDPKQWPPITKSFQVLEEKLKEFRSYEDQLGIVDYWIGRLFDMRARIQSKMLKERKRV